MEAFGGSSFDNMSSVTRKRRSGTSRRARLAFSTISDRRDLSLSSSDPSDTMSKASSDENASSGLCFSRKELNLNNPSPRVSFSRADGEMHYRRNKKDDRNFRETASYINGDSGVITSDIRRSSEGMFAPARSKSSSKTSGDSQFRNSDAGNGKSNDGSGARCSKGDISSQENKLRRVKLKVGGITRTIHAKTSVECTSEDAGTFKKSCLPDGLCKQKLVLQENSDDDPSSTDKVRSCWKDLNTSVLSSKDHILGERASTKQSDKILEPVRKSKRVPKRRVLDGASDDDEDEELQYLGRLKAAKISADRESVYGNDVENNSTKLRRSQHFMNRARADEYDNETEEYGFVQNSKEDKNKPVLELGYEDVDYIEEDDLVSDGCPPNVVNVRKESFDSFADGKKEISLTTRQRALQSGKDGSSVAHPGPIEFPNGLPPAPSRKQKDKLSDVEQQLKKAEAAQRRKLQVEKANRESEAEAIRKILGQDSNRKKKEDKQRKQRDELAWEKAANAVMLASNTVRRVTGPSGTIVTFGSDVGLPSIFERKPCSYPPPREKCAGPSCTNTYKYRDSKSRLPLCSLQCYRAVQGTAEAVSSY